jgi:site-specific DNA recombinase
MSRTAAIYARYSTDKQKDTSIEDQFALCERVALRLGLKVVGKFDDRAKSGRTQFGRDGLQDLKDAIDRRDFDVLIVEDVDRLGRDIEDNAHIRKRLKWKNIALFNHSGEMSEIEADIKNVISAQFVRDLTVKIKRGLDARAEKGLFPGAVTYGYKTVEGKPGEREIELGEAKIVYRIFREYADGVSPRDIACGLTLDGIPAPSGAERWSHQSLIGGTYGQGMLGNRLYIGEIHWNTHRTVKNLKTGKDGKRAVDPSEHIIRDVPHLRIIPQNLWDRVQARRTQRCSARIKGIRRAERSHHLLSGLLRCAACGGNMKIKGKDREGHSRIVCSSAYNYRACTNSKTYDIEAVKNTAITNLQKLLADECNVEIAVKEAAKHFETIAKRNSGERGEVTRKLTNVKVQIERIARTIIDVGDSPTMSKMLQEKEVERAGLEERLKHVSSTNLSLHPNLIPKYLEALRRFQKLLDGGQDTAELRSAFRTMISAVVVHPTGKRLGCDVEVLGWESAWGTDLFPPCRSNAEILENEGFSAWLVRQDATCRGNATQDNR